MFVSDERIRRYVHRASREGLVVRLGPRLYTTRVGDPPTLVVEENTFHIVGLLLPDAVVAHRTALELQPFENTVFVSGPHDRTVRVQQLRIRVIKGPGPLPGDRPLIQGACFVSRARAFLENLTRTRRTRTGSARTLSRPEVERRLEREVRSAGAHGLLELLREARDLAGLLPGGAAALAELEGIVHTLLGTAQVQLRDPTAIARAGGMPFDERRLARFQALFAHLAGATFSRRELPLLTREGRQNLAFFDAYFSNYIEGTEFTVEEAEEIVDRRQPPASRAQHGRDILALYDLLLNEETRRSRLRDLPGADAFLDLLRRWHRQILEAWPDSRPGIFKEQPNRAGQTLFVAPDLVAGTLVKGFSLLQQLDEPLARAALVMFVVTEVHPFNDGNGRLARALMNAELLAAGQCPILIPSVYRSDYLAPIKRLTSDGDAGPYLHMLDRAQRFTWRLDFNQDRRSLTRILKACNAFDDTEASLLRLPEEAPGKPRPIGWRRYWVPRGEPYPPWRGYLLDPQENPAMCANLVSTEDLPQAGCLVLLGEPGVGKSTELQRRHPPAELRDLRQYSDLIELFAPRSEIGPTLALDALDESPNFRRHGHHVLARRLLEFGRRAGLPHLRISCRTTDWPVALEQTLAELWGAEHVRVYELCPLRQQDVELACARDGVAPSRFLDRVRALELEPLACRPVTLDMLLRIFRAEEDLPPDRTELYQQGCLELARLETTGRTETGTAERLELAGRIAAALLLCGRSGIALEPHGAEQAGMLTVTELAGAGLSEHAVRETLRSALFTGLGAGQVTCAHQTIAEYLAQRCLASIDLDGKQLQAVLCQPGPDGEPRVSRPLKRVAAWVAAGSRGAGLFDIILRRDPDVLLQRAEELNGSMRCTLADRLIDALEEGRICDGDLPLSYYHKLKHAGLAEQLLPVIGDRKRSIFARRFAVAVAELCGVAELFGAVAELCLDPTEDEWLRGPAARAAFVLAGEDPERRRLLEPLARGEAGDDPSDQLRGIALDALWPVEIRTRELLELLSEPRRPRFHGAYASLLWRLGQEIPPPELPAALEWAARRPRRRGSDLGRLAKKILDRAWDAAEQPAVANALAGYVYTRARTGDSQLLPQGAPARFANAYRRRDLLQRIVTLDGPFDDKLAYTLLSAGLLDADDGGWMLQRAKESQEEPARRWALLLWQFHFSISAAVQDGWLELYHAGHPAVRERFRDQVEALDLTSERAQKLRAAHARQQRLFSGPIRPLRGGPEPQVIVQQALDLCEEQPVTWWRFMAALERGREEHEWSAAVEPDLTRLPGWVEADARTRARIIEAARRYLRETSCSREPWNNGLIENHRGDFAGYRALLLLQGLGALNETELSWPEWARVAGGFCRSLGERTEADDRLLAAAYREAPEEVIGGLQELLNSGAVDPGPVETIWDHGLAQALSGWVRDRAEELPEKWPAVAETLVRRGHAQSIELLRSLSASPAQPQQCRVACAAALWLGDLRSNWHVLRPWIESNATPGEELLLRVQSWRGGIGREVAALDPQHLSELLAILLRRFPPAEDPPFEGAHHVDARELIGRWRDTILLRLQQQGAADLLQRVSQDTGVDLRYQVARAEEALLEVQWRPLEPVELFHLLDRPGRRLVRSGAELLEVAIEALERIEQELHGQFLPVRNLWYPVGEGRWHPRSEEDTSDFLARELKRELERVGLAAWREVQVKRRACPAGEPGQRTDILIGAPVGPSGRELAQIVIEVKASWWRDLETAITDQLAGRYMRSLSLEHGLLVVAWYDGPDWDPDHAARKEVQRRGWTLEQARDVIAGLAREHSRPGQIVRGVVLDFSLR